LDPVTAGEAVSRTGNSPSTAAGFTSTAAGIKYRINKRPIEIKFPD